MIDEMFKYCNTIPDHENLIQVIMTGSSLYKSLIGHWALYYNYKSRRLSC